jgi:hypothetical protein
MARGNKRDRKQSDKSAEAAANSTASRKIATDLRKEAKRKGIDGSIIVEEGKACSTLDDIKEWTARHQGQKLGAPKKPTKGSSSPPLPSTPGPAPAAGPTPTEDAATAPSASPSPSPVGAATAPSPPTRKEASAASTAEKLRAITAQEKILSQTEKHDILSQLDGDLDAIKALNKSKRAEARKKETKSGPNWSTYNFQQVLSTDPDGTVAMPPPLLFPVATAACTKTPLSHKKPTGAERTPERTLQADPPRRQILPQPPRLRR